MVARYPTARPRRVNLYVSGGSFIEGVNTQGVVRVDLGTPAAKSATAIAATVDMTAGATYNLTTPYDIIATTGARFGRTLQYVASGATTANVTAFGLDFWNQPTYETKALNGTTPVLGTKAFSVVYGYTLPTVSAVTCSIGTEDALGTHLAFGAGATANGEFVDDVIASSAGTFTPIVLTTPSATTGDPRGTYKPHSSLLPNGSRSYTVFVYPYRGTYGLMGRQHYYP